MNLTQNHFFDEIFWNPSLEVLREAVDWFIDQDNVLGEHMAAVLRRIPAMHFCPVGYLIRTIDNTVRAMRLGQIRHYVYDNHSSLQGIVGLIDTFLDVDNDEMYYYEIDGGLLDQEHSTAIIDDISSYNLKTLMFLAISRAKTQRHYQDLPNDIVNLLVLGICETFAR